MNTLEHRVAYIRGGPDDESGPEMADAAMAVMDVVFESHPELAIEFVPVDAGAHCYRTHGSVVPDDSLKQILDLGIAFKAPTASAKTAETMPVSLMLRKELNAYANVNELRSYPGVEAALRPDIDVLLVRDNSEGLFQMQSAYPSADMTVDLRFITRQASQRIARVGFEYAMRRRRKLAVCAFRVGINSDQLFVASCEEVAQEYPEVEFWVRKVDAFAGTVIANPSQYDVVVTPNEWGSIMTDLFAEACGSVGLAARGNLGDETGYFEPIHGTAPGKAGKGTVNPISQIMAGKMLLDWLGRTRDDAAARVAGQQLEQAVANVLSAGKVLTTDLGGSSTTLEMVSAVSDEVRRLSSVD
ncbi:MAG TPA: isocitrate/isopropylmalate family dehydrogenase [Acidimicrobiales bacterium]|jgi:isocitrate/isopropylmalate dehydrogenase|nr:isocitrate/isopropylmalate family dehydrogenase [Acidimicrobiales bacterium]